MILCCGEALIDFVPLPESETYKPLPGGSILNIAVGLARQEVPAGFFSGLSNDFFGDQLVAHLQNNQLDVSLCPRLDAPTTLAFVSLPQSGSHEPQYAFYAHLSADRSLSIAQLPELARLTRLEPSGFRGIVGAAFWS